jgi:hypothetical protein
LALTAAAACLGVLAGASRAQPGDASGAPRLQWPVVCAVGRTCWIQKYVDRDPSPAARDYTCGTLTEDRHSGTDIRIPDMAAQRAGVEVVAAADGRVANTRDGIADVSARVVGVDTVNRIGCGNVAIVDHGGGWETWYCHMARGSVRVKPGDVVKAGQPIGRVGMSGLAEFPHLHFMLRHNRQDVDPFAPAVGAGRTCGGGASLWRSTPAYAPRAVINAGFAPGPVDMAAVEDGRVARPTAQATALVAYVRPIGLKAGDEQSFSVTGPDGQVLAATTAPRLAANEAQRLLFIGKRLRQGAWPRGSYRASYLVRANGQVVLRKDFAIGL